MGKVLGIIAEYNPFHNGHRYHLEKSKEISNCDSVVCIMGGNFTQRGNTSVVDKWSKAEMAISNGVDLVIELPVLYSISSAERFAEGAIELLNSLNIVDAISFGSESGNVQTLDSFAKILHEEPKEYITLLNHELQLGTSFPKARENAMLMYLNDIRKFANVLSEPNNILAIEYLKALKKYDSSIIPYTIKRPNNYHDTSIDQQFISATSIRKAINDGKLSQISHAIPANVYNLLQNKQDRGELVTDLSKFEQIIIYNLRKMSLEQIRNLPDVSEGLEHNIKNAANSCNNLTDLIMFIKSKRYTHSRISRILLCSLLGISKTDLEAAYKLKTPYIRVLGFTDNGQKLLSKITSLTPKLPVITSLKKFTDINTNKTIKRMLDIDIFATNTYTLGYEYNSEANFDFTKNLVKLEKPASIQESE